jgi:hypothetical protein
LPVIHIKTACLISGCWANTFWIAVMVRCFNPNRSLSIAELVVVTRQIPQSMFQFDK